MLEEYARIVPCLVLKQKYEEAAFDKKRKNKGKRRPPIFSNRIGRAIGLLEQPVHKAKRHAEAALRRWVKAYPPP
ncbi:hypothetical protein ACFX15_009701 [Malus domestica]